MKKISALVLAAAALSLVGCQGAKKEACANSSGACCSKEGSKTAMNTNASSMGTVNDMCVMSNRPVDPAITTDYMGKKVGFCCSGCVGKFNAMSDADKSGRLTKAGVRMN